MQRYPSVTKVRVWLSPLAPAQSTWLVKPSVLRVAQCIHSIDAYLRQAAL
jgi:hypothetical protein